MSQSDSPFGDSTNNVIDMGTYIGDIFTADLSGLDFFGLGATGSHTFGFSFAKSLFPTGDFVASLFQECFNDSIALTDSLVLPPPPPIRVPEPATPKIVSLVVLGMLWVARQSKKMRNRVE